MPRDIEIDVEEGINVDKDMEIDTRLCEYITKTVRILVS